MSKDQVNGNALEMSDDDFLNTDPSEFDTDPVSETDQDDSAQDDDSANEQDNDDTGDQDNESEQDDDQGDEEDDSQGEDQDSDDSGSNKDGDTASDQDDQDDKDDQDAATSNSQQQSTPGELTAEQYAEVGRQVMSDFKANGTTLKMKSADDIIQLMQMGANYHKKMAGLKPSLKTLKLLENHDLLDPEKINYLIDLSQNKPEAIKKLLKDSKIDPDDLGLDDEGDTYTPEKRTVNDTEMLLDDVIDSIKDSTNYQRTLTVLGDEWDQQSRSTIASNPTIIRTINAHMDNGIYDQVIAQVQYDRSLGKLTGVSDLAAYQTVGQRMHENNEFRTTGAQPNDGGQRNEQQSRQRDQQNNQQNNTERNNRRKAASSSRQRQTPTSKEDKDYNPLAMSDEEFERINKLSL